MLIELNGDVHEVDSGRAALTRVGPHERLELVHRRGDGAVLRLTGTSTQGFLVDVEGGHTGRRTSASRSVPASTIATMLDRFAAGDTGWPGAIVWSDEATGARTIRRTNPLLGAVRLSVGLVVAAIAVAALRRAITLPWLCDRDGRAVESVALGAFGLPAGRGDECVFVGGATIDVVDVGATAAWVEIAATSVVGLVVWFAVTRLLDRR